MQKMKARKITLEKIIILLFGSLPGSILAIYPISGEGLGEPYSLKLAIFSFLGVVGLWLYVFEELVRIPYGRFVIIGLLIFGLIAVAPIINIFIVGVVMKYGLQALINDIRMCFVIWLLFCPTISALYIIAKKITEVCNAKSFCI